MLQVLLPVSQALSCLREQSLLGGGKPPASLASQSPPCPHTRSIPGTACPTARGNTGVWSSRPGTAPPALATAAGRAGDLVGSQAGPPGVSGASSLHLEDTWQLSWQALKRALTSSHLTFASTSQKTGFKTVLLRQSCSGWG